MKNTSNYTDFVTSFYFVILGWCRCWAVLEGDSHLWWVQEGSGEIPQTGGGNHLQLYQGKSLKGEHSQKMVFVVKGKALWDDGVSC